MKVYSLKVLKYEAFPSIAKGSSIREKTVEIPVPSNARPPILVTFLPIMTEVRAEQLLNAPSPMVSTLLGMVTEVKPLQTSNAQFPMLVTLLGIAIEVRLEQSWYLQVTKSQRIAC